MALIAVRGDLRSVAAVVSLDFTAAMPVKRPIGEKNIDNGATM